MRFCKAINTTYFIGLADSKESHSLKTPFVCVELPVLFIFFIKRGILVGEIYLESVPLGTDDDSMCALGCFVGVITDSDKFTH